MKPAIIFCIAFFGVFSIILIAAVNVHSDISAQDSSEITYPDLVTVGNRSYLLSGSNWHPSYSIHSIEDMREILFMIQRFENDFPELEIIDWEIETHDGIVYGIFIDHRPKE